MLCAIAVHATAIGTFFAQDDVSFLARARGLVPTPWSLARPLSEGWTWRALDALFGNRPLPYHLFGFALHLANALLVYAIGLRLLSSRSAATAAAVLFGASSIAFTPTHWISSSLVEALVTTFTLASFRVWLAARESGRAAGLWLAALLGLAAVLSKESAILYPLVLLVAHRRLGTPASTRTLVPQTIVTAVYAIALLATLRFVHYVGSEAYAMSGSPAFIAQNLATYLRWLVAIHDPVRDAVASMNPGAWPAGLAVALGLALIAATGGGAPRRPDLVGLAWFVAFLLPVVALRHHSYLYYLYLPLPGLCWTLAAFGQRLARRWPALGLGFAALLAVLVGVELRAVRARENARVGTFLQDKTLREATMLENAIRDLRAAGIERGDRVAFVNPAPPRHVSVAGSDLPQRAPVHSYVPLEGALRGGEAIRVFFPGVEYLGFGNDLPPEWENADVFLFQDDGSLRAVGSGSPALTELGLFALRIEQYPTADRLLLRTRARGDTLADATFGLIATSELLGRAEESRRHAAEFVRRWPRDPRAAALEAALPAR